MRQRQRGWGAPFSLLFVSLVDTGREARAERFRRKNRNHVCCNLRLLHSPDCREPYGRRCLSPLSSKTTFCGCVSLLTDVPYSAVALTPNSQNDSVVFYFLKLTFVHIQRTFFHTLPLFPTRSLRLPLDLCPASS